MFSLLYGLWEYVFRKQELRVLIIGLDKSGKTTLLEKIKARSAELAHRCMYAALQAGRPMWKVQNLLPTAIAKCEPYVALHDF